MDLLLLPQGELFLGGDTQYLHAHFKVEKPVPGGRFLYFVESGGWPLRGVGHHAGPDHIHVNIRHTAPKVAVGLNGGGVVAILPEGTKTTFAGIVFLGDPPLCQLHGALNDIGIAFVINDQMDVIAGNDVIEQAKAVPFASFPKPVAIAFTVFAEPEKKVPIVASVRNVPN